MVPTLGVVLIALTVTPIFIVNAFRLLATDRFVRHEIERNGFPADAYGLTTQERLPLALRAFTRSSRTARGSPCSSARSFRTGRRPSTPVSYVTWATFASRLGVAYRAQLAVLVVLLGLAVALYRSPRWRAVVPRGILAGSLATLVIAALALPVILLGFDDFLLRFHEIFFSGTSWRCANTDTLLRI